MSIAGLIVENDYELASWQQNSDALPTFYKITKSIFKITYGTIFLIICNVTIWSSIFQSFSLIFWKANNQQKSPIMRDDVILNIVYLTLTVLIDFSGQNKGDGRLVYFYFVCMTNYQVFLQVFHIDITYIPFTWTSYAFHMHSTCSYHAFGLHY